MTTAPPGEMETAPSTEWMNGARTAQRVVTAQVAAGQSPEQIASRWAEADATYDGATATAAQREWHAGAMQTARHLIDTYRTAQAAETAGVTREQIRQAHPGEPELQAG